MDQQYIFNALFSVCGVIAGWVVNNLYKAITRLEEDLKEFPHYYVSKEDYRSDINDIKQMLNKIFDRLDTKADK